MGSSMRYFLVEDDGSVVRIPASRMDALFFGGGTWPSHAGRMLRVAEMLVELEDRRPKLLLREVFCLIKLNAKGAFDKAHRRLSLVDAIEAISHETPGVKGDNVLGRGVFEKRRRRTELFWRPTPEIQTRLRRAALEISVTAPTGKL